MGQRRRFFAGGCGAWSVMSFPHDFSSGSAVRAMAASASSPLQPFFIHVTILPAPLGGSERHRKEHEGRLGPPLLKEPLARRRRERYDEGRRYDFSSERGAIRRRRSLAR